LRRIEHERRATGQRVAAEFWEEDFTDPAAARSA